MAVRRKMIRELTEQLLHKNGISDAPVPIEKIAKTEKIDISLQDADSNISGFVVRDPKNHRVVVGVNKKHHRNRRRFTIAHELGHYFLHPGDVVHVDRFRRAFQVHLRDEEASAGTNEQEKEANLFAAELLMPVTFLERDLPKLQDLDLLTDKSLTELAGKYQVSVEALSFRLSYLGYIEV